MATTLSRLEARYQAGGQVACHGDHTAGALHVPRVGKIEKAAKNARLQILQIVQPVQNHGVGGAGPALLQFQHSPLEGSRRRQAVFADVSFSPLDDLRIVQHEDLWIEDPGLNDPKTGFGVSLQHLQAVAGPVQRRAEPFEFAAACLLAGGRPGRNLRHAPGDAMYVSLCDALGRREARDNHRSVFQWITHRTLF